MKNDRPIRKTSIYLGGDLLRQLKRLAIERGTSVNTIVLEAIQRKYADDPEIAAAMPPDRSHHQALVEKLIYILDSESADAIDAVKTNIEVFFRLVAVDDKKAGRKRDIPTDKGENNDKLTG